LFNHVCGLNINVYFVHIPGYRIKTLLNLHFEYSCEVFYLHLV